MLGQLERMPDILAGLLGLSSSTLMFCLGYEKEAAEAIEVEDFHQSQMISSEKQMKSSNKTSCLNGM